MAEAPAAPEQQPTAPLAPQRPPSIEERISASLSAAGAEPPAEEPKREEAPQAVSGELERETETPEQPDAGAEKVEHEESSAGAEQEVVETVELGTLADVAEHIGVQVDDLYDISVPIDIDGKRQELTIGEWKDRVRAGVQSDALAEERKAFAAERRDTQEKLQQQSEAMRIAFAEAAALTEAAEKQLQGEVESLAALRESDPAEWSAKQTELKQRQDAIEEAKRELRDKWQQQVETQQAESQAQMQAHITREREALLAAIPEWRDESVFDSERKEMRDYLSRSGFRDDEIETAVDHRLILMARKAMAYDAQDKAKSLARKKVAKVAKKVVKPGATQGKQAAAEDALAKLRTEHKKSGKVDSAALLIAARRRG